MIISKAIRIHCLIILILAIQSCGVAPRTLGTYIEDYSIVSRAKDIVNTSHDKQKSSSVQAHAYNEILLLTGEVSKEKTRLNILEDMTKIPKVRQIHNEIHISDPISTWSKVTDSFIKTKIRSKIFFKKRIKPREIKIISRNGTVYLMGMVNNLKAEELTKIVQRTKGVKSVVVLFENSK
jgi:osmotically-inducible protein OsmY